MIKQIEKIVFPDKAEITDVSVSLTDMGERTITLTVKIDGDVAPDFSQDLKIRFNGETYIHSARRPQATKDNNSRRATYSLTFQHEAIVELQRYYFIEMASTDAGTAIADKYDASLGLTLPDFITALKKVLSYYFGNKITASLNPSWESSDIPSYVEINYSYIWDVLQKVYEIYAVRWTIERAGAEEDSKYIIKFGYDAEDATHIFEYGYKGGLLKVERQVQSTNIKNILLGRGGDKNLPMLNYFKGNDPDACPELANISFTELRSAEFRSYVQGWNSAHDRSSVDTEPAYVDWAYQKGYSDSTFNPVEYVKDDKSIEEYGKLWGALENNEEIYPSMEGLDDDIVAVDEITVDDDVIERPDVEQTTVSGFEIPLGTIKKNQSRTFHKASNPFNVPNDKMGALIFGVMSLSGNSKEVKLSLGKGGIHIKVTLNGDNAALLEADFNLQIKKSYEVINPSSIPPGTYYIEANGTVNNTSNTDIENVKVKFESSSLVIGDGTNTSNPNVFHIWIKNIWGSKQNTGESDEEYTNRVWQPILGTESEEAAVVFRTGLLSISDYNFLIVKDGNESAVAHDETKEGSHWRLTLQKSDAEYAATGKLLPNSQINAKAGDRFYFTGIELPHKYVVAAEERLYNYKMSQLNIVKDIQPTWVVTIDKIRANKLEEIDEVKTLAEQLKVGAKIRLRDKRFMPAGKSAEYIEQYIQSVTYSWKEPSNNSLYLYPDIEVVLSDEVTGAQNPVETLSGKIDALERQIGYGGNGTGVTSNIQQILRALFNRIYLRKDMSDTTPYKLTSSTALEVGNFVPGSSGAIVYRDAETGQTIGELDKLYVRMKAYFETLEIVNVNSIGGKQIISPAGAVRLALVVEPGKKYTENSTSEEGEPIDTEVAVPEDTYRCFFLAEQDGQEVENRYKKDDQVQSKDFNITKPGKSNKVVNHYYWRLVTGVSNTPVIVDGVGYHYVDLSATDADTKSDAPAVGDVIAQLGNRTDVDRQNALVFSSVDTFSPSITLYQGINNYSYEGKEMVSYGVDKTKNQAFMNVYGNMFVGKRDNSTYIKYTQENGVEIKGKLAVGSTLGNGKTIEETLKEVEQSAIDKSKENIDEFVNALTKDVENLQNQIDGAIETWFYDPAPTLENLPASEWTTDELKNMHLGDLYYSGEGRAYRFQMEGGKYVWKEIIDSDITKALENAKKAQDTADSKRKVFVKQPTVDDEYDVGDLWVNATYGEFKNDVLRAVKAKKSGEAFNISHWMKASNYTDDTALNTFINEYQSTIEDIKTQTDQKAETWYQGTDPSTDWKTEADKEKHKGDLWYDTSRNRAYYWTGSAWVESNAPESVFDAIDGKSSVFVSKPTNYKENDLWFLEKDYTLSDVPYKTGTLVVAIRDMGLAWSANDWIKKDRYGDEAEIREFLEKEFNQKIDYLQQQTDKRAETWYQATDPSTDWSEEDKAKHKGDLWYDTDKQQTFIYNGEGWDETKSTPPDVVFDRIDGKAQIFTSQPKPPYNVGDLWYAGADQPVKVCKTAKPDGGVFAASDWAKRDYYTDDSALNNFIENTYKEDINVLKQQADKKAETWYQEDDPSEEWTDATTKSEHIGDLWYNSTATVQKYYRWNGTEWEELTSTPPDAVFDRIDGKAQIFVEQPKPPYNVGDLWYAGADQPVKVCKTAKPDGGVFAASDWAKRDYYTDDTKANQVQANVDKLSTTVNNLSGTVSNMKNFTDTAFADGIVDRSEKSAISNYINIITTTQKDVEKAYASVYNNALLEGVPKTNLKTGYDAFNTAAKELISAINTAIEDGKTTSTERANVDAKYTNFNTKYGDFVAYINAANKAIQDKINAAAQDALTQIGGLAYLKQALKEDTTVRGGLIQSSVLALGYTVTDGVYKVMSGTNGIYESSKRGGGIASWWGGAMKDRADYEAGAIPADAATGLIRMDGTGYFANGALWWDIDGNLHADPQSFIIKENQLGDYLELFQIIYRESTKTIDYMIPQYVMQHVEAADYLQIGDGRLKWDATNKAIYVEGKDGNPIGFYSKGWVSALGASPNSGGGTGGGGGLIESVYGYADLGKTFSDSNLNDTFNAYTVNRLASRITSLENSSITEVPWGIITNKPSTLGGYGITDALSKTGTAADSSKLGGFTPASYDYVSAYNFTTGCLVKTNISASSPAMCFVHIIGNGYASLREIDTTLQFYNYPDGNSIINSSATNYGLDFGDISIFNYDGVVYIWFKQTGAFQTFFVYVHYNYGICNRVTSITNASKPTSGITRQVTVTPKDIALTTSNVASATKLATSRTIWGQPFNGTADVSGALSGVTDITASGVYSTTALNPGFKVVSGSTDKACMGWTDEAGAYIFNYTSLESIGAHDNGYPVYGKAGNRYMMPYTRKLFYKADYERWVVLLWEETTGTRRLTGELFSSESGSARYGAADVRLWYSRWGTATSNYDSNFIFNTYGVASPWNLITCKYGGKTYFALQYTNTTATSAYFTGTYSGISFTAIKYYTTTHDNVAAVVNNSEIYNSIADVTTSVISANGTNYALTSSNVASATKLQTSRTINGTNFDGTSNITTSYWGTARNIGIVNSDGTGTAIVTSVNGGAAVNLKLPAEIKANLSGNATTATTLQTPRTLWGQSFDGSASINGTLTSVGHIQFLANATYSIGTDTNNVLTVHAGTIKSRSTLYVESGTSASIIFKVNAGTEAGRFLQPNGYLGLGTTSPTERLHVAGNITANILKSTIATGTAPLTVASTTKVTNLNADMLDNIHFQNILERDCSGSSYGSSVGWYRIGEVMGNDAGGAAFILSVGRNYTYSNNEYYIFAITLTYGGYAVINQLSGTNNESTPVLTQIRLTGNSSGTYYVDIYIGKSTSGNTYYWTSFGKFKCYTAWITSPSEGNNTTTFGTREGSKIGAKRGDISFYTEVASGNSATGLKVGYSMTVARSNYNNAHIAFKYVGAGSTSNYATIGFYGKEDLFNVLASGNVGIGTFAPSYKLHVVGDIYSTGNIISPTYTLNNSSTNPYLKLVHGGINWYLQAYSNTYMYLGAETTNSLRIDNQGNTYTPGTFNAKVGIWSDGYVSAKGQNTTSDMRLKNKGRDVFLTIKDIANAPAFEYTWKDGTLGVMVGSSAQYWRGINENFAPLGPDRRHFEMMYGNLGVVLGISLARHFETLEERVKRLEKENLELREFKRKVEQRLSA